MDESPNWQAQHPHTPAKNTVGSLAVPPVAPKKPRRSYTYVVTATHPIPSGCAITFVDLTQPLE